MQKLGTGGCGAFWEPAVGTAGVYSLKNKEPGEESAGLIGAWRLQKGIYILSRGRVGVGFSAGASDQYTY